MRYSGPGRILEWPFVLFSSFFGFNFVYENVAQAQIIPDTSFGEASSRISPNIVTDQGVIDLIEGGSIRNEHVFHSFSDFNISNGQQVYFSNPTLIENIFSRVTGNNTSEILGTLGVLGNANLFFINPNGIYFGPDAKLDVRGTFVASTASGIHFDSGYQFRVDKK
jgi:filamentous hemagglutinin family protein